METTQSIEGFPTPEWSMHGTQQELTARIGADFEFMGPGWYSEKGQHLLVCAEHMEPPPSPIAGLVRALGIGGGDEDEGTRRYLCYSWSLDPRPRMVDLLRMGDQTEVEVPRLMAQAWPQVKALGEELRAWAMSQIIAAAAERGAEAPAADMMPVIGDLPGHLVAGQVEDLDAGIHGYKFGVYYLHLLPAEALASLREEMGKGGELPPYARAFEVTGAAGAGAALTLRPST